MKILFVCKANMFRSRVAEAYFNKINKNKKIIATSAGIFKGDTPEKSSVNAAKKLGIEINGKPKPISLDLLRKTDLIIIVADNVSSSEFKFQTKEITKKFVKKIIRWEITDEKTNKEKEITGIIKKIMKKVDKLVKGLSKK